MNIAASISVVIRTYSLQRWEGLVESLESVYAQNLKPYQVVVVVDHNEELLQRVKEYFPSVDVVENRYAQGSSGAWNSGVYAARGEVIAFMDDDAAAQPDWLEQLIAPYHDPKIMGVGGKINPKWLSGRPSWFPEEFDWVVGCTYKGLPESLAPVRNLIGCNMSFRATAFDIVGGFRSGMGHVGANPIGCDETELCIRLRQCKPDTILLYEPLAIVHHSVPQQRATFRYFIKRCALEGGSKALVTRYVGVQDGLSAERSHALKILPRAILSAIRDAMSGFAKAGAIFVGLTVTAFNYLVGRVSVRETSSDTLKSEQLLS